MTALVWISGAVLLLAAAAAPLVSGRRRRQESAAVAQDRARDLLSRLDLALDRPDLTARQRREAERCRLLAGAALAGQPGAGDAARARKWAENGLAALGKDQA